MKKVVLRLDFPNEKIKQKAIKKVSRLSGLESIALDPKDKRLTVIGDIDPVDVVGKLTNVCYTQIVSIGPAEEPKKKEEKKEGGPKEDQSAQLAFPASYYYQHPDFFQQPPVAVALPPYAPPYDHRSVEEVSSGCVIC